MRSAAAELSGLMGCGHAKVNCNRMARSDDIDKLGLEPGGQVEEMLMLADRLRRAQGSELDDSAVAAVSEATGAPEDYVRLALQSLSAQKREGVLARWRRMYLAFDPAVRRTVLAGLLGSVAGFFRATSLMFGDPSSLMDILVLLLSLGAIFNCGQAPRERIGALAGAVYGATLFIGTSIFVTLFGLFNKTVVGEEVFLLFPWTIGGAMVGYVANHFLQRNQKKLGMKDPLTERQELLRQLVDLQDKLRGGEQNVTFLSVDMVGSTQMKAGADPLAVEYTFTEYHRYVESAGRRYGGRVHSTAGDGMNLAFDGADQAFAAARNILSGLPELNTYRNRIGTPIRLRAAVHSGPVLLPGSDIQSVNFAHVIDIAAHLQRVCPEGCLVVSEPAVLQLRGGPQSVGEESISAMDVRGYVWRPRAWGSSLSKLQTPG